jgi:type I restriction enzyme S subunit
MAIWSEITAKTLGRYTTLSADYYSPDHIEAQNTINKTDSSYPLNALCEKQSPITYGILKPRNVDSGIYKLARIQNSEGFFIDANDLPAISEDQFDEYKRSEVSLGDLVIAIGGYIGPIGIISNINGFRININRHLARISPNPQIIDPYYLLAYLFSNPSKKLLQREIRGAVQAGINIADLKLHPVFLPIQQIQVSIGNIMRSAEKKKNIAKRFYIQAQELLEQELGLDKLTFEKSRGYEAKFSEVSNSLRGDAEYYNPYVKKIVNKIESFDNIKLGTCYNIQNGYPWRSDMFLNDNSGEPVIRIRDIRPGSIDTKILTSIIPSYANAINFSKANASDIVVGMDGLKYFYAGIIEDDCYINQRVAHLKSKINSNISPEYLSFIINSKLGQSQLLRDMTIATTVGHITNLNIMNLTIPYPSRKFHDEITKLVRGSIDAKHESKQLLEKAKQQVEDLIEQAAGES